MAFALAGKSGLICALSTGRRGGSGALWPSHVGATRTPKCPWRRAL